MRDTKEVGATIVCTERELSRGPTAESTKAATKPTRNTGSESTAGPTVENTKVASKTEDNTAKVYTRKRTRISNSGSGKTAKR